MSQVDRPPHPLAVVVGPTAVGKTAVALELAQSVAGEIVSADSRLIYRGMDIGTAKPTEQERAKVPHHLIDVVEPDQVLTLAEYQGLAFAAINGIHRRGRIPVLVGGSGQYVRAVVEGWQIPRVTPDAKLRAELEQFSAERGIVALHDRLAQLDPAAAARIDPRNVRRVVRALEVTMTTGRPMSALQSKSPPPYRLLQLGLIRPRPVLYSRIDARIEDMMRAGLVQEVRGLSQAGYGFELPSMSGLGYRQIGLFLAGQVSLDAAIQLMRRETRRLVRQQSTWFRPDDSGIRWLNLEVVSIQDVVEIVANWLQRDPSLSQTIQDGRTN